jgi:uncharacterized protein YkwD
MAATAAAAAAAALLLALTPGATRIADLLPPVHVSASSDVVETPIAIALTNPHPHAVPADAQALADGVNAERAKRGLPPLERDPALDRIAYAKAADMAARQYFGHTDPNGVTFYQRMQAWHWPTTYVAENIAFDRSEQRAQIAFVNSPPHYSNQIDPRELHIGVAVITVGSGETFYVEDFSGN